MFKRLQRLTITRRDEDRLILRELPLMGWFFSGLFFITGFIMLQIGWQLAGSVAFLVGFFFAATSQLQYIVFDRAAETVTVMKTGILGQQIATSLVLSDVRMAYLYMDDAGAYQAVLILHDDILGLSTRSPSGVDWKEKIVLAINDFLKVDNTTPSLDDIHLHDNR